MPTTNELLVPKVQVRLKVVPDAEPNADGAWVTVFVSESYLSRKTDWSYLNSILPDGFHCVKVKRTNLLT